MTITVWNRHRTTIAAALLVAFWVGEVPADESGVGYAELIKTKSPALVTVKFVLKMGESERESEITALLIEANGLVLCSSMRLGGMFRMSNMSVTPTDLKVFVGDDTEGLEAKLVSRDSELDLAWVRIKDPGKDLPFVDLSKSASPKPGDRLLSMKRLGKFFDRAVVVTDGRVSGQVKKPRALIVPSDGLGAEPGLPVFSSSGDVVGVVVLQMPDPEEMGMSFMALARGGDAGIMVLPAAQVAKATKRAMEAAEEEDDEDDEDGEDEDKSGDG